MAKRQSVQPLQNSLPVLPPTNVGTKSGPQRHAQQSAVFPKNEPVLEVVALTSLRPHPRNYRDHPADQLEHLKQSIQKHHIYRNVVIARDGTILAGHGVVQALST